jgi:hypothetical protein
MKKGMLQALKAEQASLQIHGSPKKIRDNEFVLCA